MATISDKQLKCATQVINYSSISQTDRFDKPSFDKVKFLSDLEMTSPKLIALIKNIKKLDKQDFVKTGKLFKHYIYSSVGNGYGSKIIASALIAAGYTLAIKKQGSKIVPDPQIIQTKNESKFMLLSSTALWNTSVTPAMTKEILAVFNKRPDNIYGESARLIVLDSGFKEGIDLFDIKYVHIFEDQLLNSDNIQSQGRALRYCGQQGLHFRRGWTVNVFNYSLVNVEGVFDTFFPKGSALRDYSNKSGVFEIFLKESKALKLRQEEKLEDDIIEIIKESAVDADLNKNINKYKRGYLERIRNFFAF